MDFVEINRFTQERKIKQSRDLLYAKNLNQIEALRLLIYASRKMYGINNTSLILHKIGVENLDLST